ncbi:hypothetical protein PR048_030117 [Dryococelus australis]|uniref:Uncharacterized protein n=1 Tax=Dryococelus australis TaxID=614101 RepID=A0ABQ9G818_9NEOP|nr:hypothetical protein PR048_030117 [Dryococelus australis]
MSSSVKRCPNLSRLYRLDVSTYCSPPAFWCLLLDHAGIVPNDAVGRRVFSGISRFPPLFNSGTVPYSPRFTLVGSQNLAVKNSPNLFNHSKVVAAVNSEVLRADEGEARWVAAPECRGGRKWETTEKTRPPATSFVTILTCENPRSEPAGNRIRFASSGDERSTSCVYRPVRGVNQNAVIWGNGSTQRKPRGKLVTPATFPTCENARLNPPGNEPSSPWSGRFTTAVPEKMREVVHTAGSRKRSMTPEEKTQHSRNWLPNRQTASMEYEECDKKNWTKKGTYTNEYNGWKSRKYRRRDDDDTHC